MLKKFTNKNLTIEILASLVSFTSILIIWEILVTITDVSQIVLIPPSEILPSIIEENDILMEALFFTFYEIVLGWFIGNFIAFIIAILIYKFVNLSKILINLAVLINAIPLIALAAILGGIIGTDQNAKMVLVAILCFFPMFISSLKAFSNTDRQKKSLLKTYAPNEVQEFMKLTLLESLPTILNTLKISVIVAIFAGIVGEFFGAQGGIGNLILMKRGLYDLDIVWAAIFYVIIAGSLFYFLIEFMQKLMTPWRK